jgi:lysophospholipase L1-like esterase
MSYAVTKRAKIILFGDSITQMSFSAADSGWGAWIADRYQRRADVLNRGFSGYNSDWFLKFADTNYGKADLFDHDNVKIVTVFFGANDASDVELNSRQHVPLERYKSNIKEIATLARNNFGVDVKIILIAPPPVCHDARLKFQKEKYKEKATGKLERTLELSGRYAKALTEVAEELNLPCLDVWTKMQNSTSLTQTWEEYLSDGLHLSAAGNKFLGEALLDLIDDLLPELAVTKGITGNIDSSSRSSMRSIAPWHDEIDQKSFSS